MYPPPASVKCRNHPPFFYNPQCQLVRQTCHYDLSTSVEYTFYTAARAPRGPQPGVAEAAPSSALRSVPMHLKGSACCPCFSLAQDKVHPNPESILNFHLCFAFKVKTCISHVILAIWSLAGCVLWCCGGAGDGAEPCVCPAQLCS